MDGWKKCVQRLLFPKWWITVLSVPAAAAGLLLAFGEKAIPQWLEYAAYALSAVSLTWVCALVCRDWKGWKESWQSFVDRTPVLKRYFTDAAFKTHVSLYRALGLNVVYAIWKCGLGVYYRSVWFATLGVYYLFLAVMRFCLLWDTRRNAFGTNMVSEWKRCRLCGVLLLSMNLALSGMVILVVLENQGFHYAGYLIYVMAAYAFYNITAAGIRVVKFRKFKSPVMSAAKILQLSAALVSMLALETAMLEQFGGDNPVQMRRIMTGCTGVGVCAMILGIAIYMIARSNQNLKKLKGEQAI